MKVVKNPEGESHQSMKQDSHIGEVSVFLKGGVTIKVTESAGDLDTVVDLLSHTLTESLKRHKDKFVDKMRHSPGIGALTAEPDDSA
jgi:ribosome-associated translation inhibitor RaiA